MKTISKIILFLMMPTVGFSQTLEKELLNHFTNNDTIIISADSIDYDKVIKNKELDTGVVYKYLCGIKNACFYNPANYYPYYYYPLSKKEFNTFWLISYLVTDTYECDIYIEAINKNNNASISRLNVWGNIGAAPPFLYSKIHNDTIEIIRKEQKHDDYGYFYPREVYKIDEYFTPLVIDTPAHFIMSPLGAIPANEYNNNDSAINEQNDSIPINEQNRNSESINCNNHDTGINGLLKLNDPISFNKYLLKNRKEIFYDDWLYFSSKDKKQYIGLQTNYGGGVDEYKQFEISYIDGKYTDFVPLRVQEAFKLNGDSTTKFSFTPSDMKNFTTESGIKLGMSEEEFRAAIKTNFTVEHNKNITIYKYSNDDCLYESEYRFENNKLIWFNFGYMTP